MSKRARAEANGSADSSLATEMMAYIDASPTPFHLCAETSAMLRAAGFVELDETDAWRPLLKPGGKYFYVRGGCVVAFFVGAAFEAGNGFNIVAAHTDSPVLKLKPCSKKSAHGCIQINVEAYGGGLWHTWFDRELTLAGAVIVKAADGSFSKKLVHVKRPLLRIPTLCIHLTTAEERGKFAPNKETHLQVRRARARARATPSLSRSPRARLSPYPRRHRKPILGLINDAVNKPAAAQGDKGAPHAARGMETRHAPELLRVLAAELECEVADMMDFEMTLCDTQPSQIWGLGRELVSGPRLDNQMHCFTALRALLHHAASAPATAADVSLIALFDHEEVGSDSSTGAGGPIMNESMQRISSCFAADEPHAAAEALHASTRRSFLMSADSAHAVHPNYAERHQAAHAPILNKGTVIKTNDNQRYATNGDTGSSCASSRASPADVQEFMVKNDCPCGSTIGPLLSSKTVRASPTPARPLRHARARAPERALDRRRGCARSTWARAAGRCTRSARPSASPTSTTRSSSSTPSSHRSPSSTGSARSAPKGSARRARRSSQSGPLLGTSRII